jgi:hypothetical protein
MESSYRVAGIDVHKKILAVVVIDAAREGEFEFERRKFGTTARELGLLAAWLGQQEVREVVMESTAQYWKPVWRELGGTIQAASGTGPIQSRAQGPQIGFCRCRASGQAAGGGRANPELCAGSGTAVMAYHDTYQSSIGM